MYLNFEIHLYGSTNGYQELSASEGLVHSEKLILNTTGFGDIWDESVKKSMESHPVVCGRPLPTGRIALTRFFVGVKDVARRLTTELRTIVISVESWNYLRSGRLDLFFNDTNIWNRENFLKNKSCVILVNYLQSPKAVTGEVHHIFSKLAEDPEASYACKHTNSRDQAILSLLANLPTSDFKSFSWGIRMLSTGLKLSVCTLNPGVDRIGNVLELSFLEEKPLNQFAKNVINTPWELPSLYAHVIVEDETTVRTKTDSTRVLINKNSIVLAGFWIFVLVVVLGVVFWPDPVSKLDTKEVVFKQVHQEPLTETNRPKETLLDFKKQVKQAADEVASIRKEALALKDKEDVTKSKMTEQVENPSQEFSEMQKANGEYEEFVIKYKAIEKESKEASDLSQDKAEVASKVLDKIVKLFDEISQSALGVTEKNTDLSQGICLKIDEVKQAKEDAIKISDEAKSYADKSKSQASLVTEICQKILTEEQELRDDVDNAIKALNKFELAKNNLDEAIVLTEKAVVSVSDFAAKIDDEMKLFYANPTKSISFELAQRSAISANIYLHNARKNLIKLKDALLKRVTAINTAKKAIDEIEKTAKKCQRAKEVVTKKYHVAQANAGAMQIRDSAESAVDKLKSIENKLKDLKLEINAEITLFKEQEDGVELMTSALFFDMPSSYEHYETLTDVTEKKDLNTEYVNKIDELVAILNDIKNYKLQGVGKREIEEWYILRKKNVELQAAISVWRKVEIMIDAHVSYTNNKALYLMLKDNEKDYSVVMRKPDFPMLLDFNEIDRKVMLFLELEQTMPNMWSWLEDAKDTVAGRKRGSISDEIDTWKKHTEYDEYEGNCIWNKSDEENIFLSLHNILELRLDGDYAHLLCDEYFVKKGLEQEDADKKYIKLKMLLRLHQGCLKSICSEDNAKIIFNLLEINTTEDIK